MKTRDLATNRVLLHALNLGWKPISRNSTAIRHFHWAGPQMLTISQYKGVKTLDYTVGSQGTTSEDVAIRWLDEAVRDYQKSEPCEDCARAKRHAYSDATTPGFFFDLCEKHREEAERKRVSARLGVTPEEIAAKHEQQQKLAEHEWDCGCPYCLKARSLAQVNSRRIKPKGVRGQ